MPSKGVDMIEARRKAALVKMGKGVERAGQSTRAVGMSQFSGGKTLKKNPENDLSTSHYTGEDLEKLGLMMTERKKLVKKMVEQLTEAKAKKVAQERPAAEAKRKAELERERAAREQRVGAERDRADARVVYATRLGRTRDDRPLGLEARLERVELVVVLVERSEVGQAVHRGAGAEEELITSATQLLATVKPKLEAKGIRLVSLKEPKQPKWPRQYSFTLSSDYSEDEARRNMYPTMWNLLELERVAAAQLTCLPLRLQLRLQLLVGL